MFDKLLSHMDITNSAIEALHVTMTKGRFLICQVTVSFQPAIIAALLMPHENHVLAFAALPLIMWNMYCQSHDKTSTL